MNIPVVLIDVVAWLVIALALGLFFGQVCKRMSRHYPAPPVRPDELAARIERERAS